MPQPPGSQRRTIASKLVLFASFLVVVSLGLFMLSASSCGSDARAQSPVQSPAAITASSRDITLTADFLRVSYVSSTTDVQSLGRPGALRAFVTATRFFQPAVPLAQMVTYPGLADQPAQDMVAMRCVSPSQEKVDAFLATWPNVFAAVQRDLAGRGFSCPSAAGAGDNEVYCIARQFSDTPNGVVVTTLANALDAANTLFDPAFAERAAWLRTNYGIYPAFSGLGFSVKDSYYLDPAHPTTGAQVLQNSIAPEYLVRNVTLADGSCRCIRVSPYDGRDQAALDPDFVWANGGVGSCTKVSRLGD